MKRILLDGLIGIFLINAALLAQSTPQATPAKPDTAATIASKAKLYTDEIEFAFGWMPSDATISHAFWMHSRGEDSLKILSVKPG